jgi:transcriptional regulator with XRE-family HTH domain
MLVSLSSRKTTAERLLKSKEYRDAYVLEHIKNGVAFQIRTLREDRDWTQGDLGDAMGKPRNVVSRIEDPNYGKTTLTTLREVAAAFDVGLLVKFVPFSRLVREYEDVSPVRLSARSITSTEEIAALSEWVNEEFIASSLADTSSASRVVMLSDWATRYDRVAVDIATSARSAHESSITESQQRQLFFDKPRKEKKSGRRQPASRTLDKPRKEKKSRRRQSVSPTTEIFALTSETTSARYIKSAA